MLTFKAVSHSHTDIIMYIRKLRTQIFYKIGSQCQYHKHFMCVTYGWNKISLCILKTLHGSMHAMSNGAAYFTRAVNYACKMLWNGTACLKKFRQLFEYRHLLLLSDTWWLKILIIYIYIFYSFFQRQCFYTSPAA